MVRARATMGSETARAVMATGAAGMAATAFTTHEALVELRARGNDGEVGSSVGVDQEGRDGGWRSSELGVAGNGVCARAVRDDLGSEKRCESAQAEEGIQVGTLVRSAEAVVVWLAGNGGDGREI